MNLDSAGNTAALAALAAYRKHSSEPALQALSCRVEESFAAERGLIESVLGDSARKRLHATAKSMLAEQGQVRGLLDKLGQRLAAGSDAAELEAVLSALLLAHEHKRGLLSR